MSVRKIKTFRQWPTLLGEAVHERLKFLLKILGMSLLFLFIGPPKSQSPSRRAAYAFERRLGRCRALVAPA
jgi:hypothetical protein